MILSFSKLKLDVYSDILRIKKPSRPALIAGQMLCKVVCSFRGSTSKSSETDFEDWKEI